jgi:hypothetical protein
MDIELYAVGVILGVRLQLNSCAFPNMNFTRTKLIFLRRYFDDLRWFHTAVHRDPDSTGLDLVAEHPEEVTGSGPKKERCSARQNKTDEQRMSGGYQTKPE